MSSSSETVFNHLVLPPQLPGRQDACHDDLTQTFIALLDNSIGFLAELAPHAYKDTLSALRNTLSACSKLNRGRLDRTSLVDAFNKIEQHPLILHVVDQNAALIIRSEKVSDSQKSVIFEAFEASPASEQVLAAEDALICTFPGRAALMPLSAFQNDDFQQALGEFLECSSMESLSRFTAKTRKAGAVLLEERDSSDPALITQMLMPLLETLGAKCEVPLLKKRIHDDVSINEALFPWRRHPFWLVLRVAIQRLLCLDMEAIAGRTCYKFLNTILLADFMKGNVGELRPELTLLLRSKVCRRLAKLEMEKDRMPDGSIYHELFDATGAWLTKLLEDVSQKVDLGWQNFKTQTTKIIPSLPQKAPRADMRLTLPSSGDYLDTLLRLPPVAEVSDKSISPLQIKDEDIKQVQKFTRRYFDLAELDKNIQDALAELSLSDEEDHDRCVEVARRLCDYMDAVQDAYDTSPEYTSRFILRLFELWVSMDTCAVHINPLLGEYQPVFKPDLLDALQLSDVRDLGRLQAVQQHLQKRLDTARRPSIFASFNTSDSFSHQCLLQSEELQELQEEIQSDADKARTKKQTEWDHAQQECESLTERIAGLQCYCTIEGLNADGTRLNKDITNCSKCFLWRQRNRLQVKSFEEYLPSHPTEQSELLFELLIPQDFQAYRNATFRLLRLSYPTAICEGHTPLKLPDFEQLLPYMEETDVAEGISLASTTKSCSQTHFSDVKVRKGSVQDVLLPFGPHFDLYDNGTKVWVKDLDLNALTLQHRCGISIPRCLKDVLPPEPHLPAVVDGPPSYQVVANQRQCPQQASLHEFSAYQALLRGSSQRWINILTEFGSSNLNFSNEDTARLLADLAIQAGPSSHGCKLRDTFAIFEDEPFCLRLAGEIEKRLMTISGSFREASTMSLLLTLLQRLHALSRRSTTPRSLAMNLIKSARKATLGWISRLRAEFSGANDASTAERITRYAFRASLLTRRTFSSTTGPLTPEELSFWCHSSIGLQEFMVPQAVQDDPDLKAMLIRDTEMAWRMRRHIKASILNSPSALEKAISQVWGVADGTSDEAQSKTRFSKWDHVEEDWVACQITTVTPDFDFSQTVHFNYIEGYLLVDGKPLGRLPAKIRNSPEVKSLFGDAHLRTFPSGHAGMSYQLASNIEGHQIHFGLRKETVVVRAISRHGVMELLSPMVFNRNGVSDLPLNLIEGCVHWLHLSGKRVEIRRRPKIWKLRGNDWVIDLLRREAKRGLGKRSYLSLIDPFSLLSRRITKIFENFERPEGVTITQPENGRLRVNLPRFELSWTVNYNSRLEEGKLKMEMDPSQDAGTLYGLHSKLVVKHVRNPRRRSILIPLGKPMTRKAGPHIEINIDSSGSVAYLRYDIDEVMGRLTSAPETPLLYTKAYLHALTSFPLPDPLTGRTGLEEAIHILESGQAQPWQPMGPAIARLQWIAELAPTREYYPPDKRRLQKTIFSSHMTMNIQHDRLEILANSLIRKSQRLEPFYQATDAPEETPLSLLRRRGMARRRAFEPSSLHCPDLELQDRDYQSRDHDRNSQYAHNVIEITSAVFQRPFRLREGPKLHDLLQAKIVGGFQASPAATSLTRLVEDPIVERFGDLANFSRNLEPGRLFSLAFRLALLGFDRPDNNEMQLLRVLSAFGRLDALKVLQPPSHPVFVDFGVQDAPDIDQLARLMRPLWPEFQAPRKAKRVDRTAQDTHVLHCEEESRRLSKFFCRQWPSQRPTLDNFAPKTKLISEPEALEVVIPMWDRLHANLELKEYVLGVQGVLDKYISPEDESEGLVQGSIDEETFPRVYFETVPRPGPVIPILRDLLTNSISMGLGPQAHLSPGLLVESKKAYTAPSIPVKEMGELDRLLQSFTNSADILRRQYGKDLDRSLRAMKENCNTAGTSTVELRQGFRTTGELSFRAQQVCDAIDKQHGTVIRALADGRYQWLRAANLWPGTDTVTLLEQLRSRSRVKYGPGMKQALVRYGLLITLRQWLNRTVDSIFDEESAKLEEQLTNTGHENWDPEQHPDWLLMEIEADLLIRPQQIEVARQIISPTSAANSVLQLNMGQGKTSCIVPLAIASLADSTQLVRLVCPKALIPSTAQVIQSRIGGLVGVEMRHIPYARRTPSTVDMIRLYSELHREVRKCGGVLLTTPDTVLSHRLSAVQRVVDGKTVEAHLMNAFSDQLTKGCRDIIDESDLSLGVKTQLIYPSGPQVQVDGAPQRWEVAESLLMLASENLQLVRRNFPRGLEIASLQASRGSGSGFPMAHFLQKEAEDELNRLIVDDICNGRTPFLRPSESVKGSETFRQQIRRVLTEPSYKALMESKDGLKEAISMFADKEAAPKILFLIRGLLLNRILVLCLRKRWNVGYGLHPGRDPIAVPYEAKGVPSEQAEFGHPDVSIILTILSHFYGGLSLSQFRQSLEHVLKSDDPSAEYDRFISGSSSLPEQYKHFYIINSDDKGQVDELHQHLRFDRNVCVHYLNTFVFPVHAKAFTFKLSASSWDIPLYPKPGLGTVQKARTTGFSGTNDNKSLLPLTITQDDLPSLVQTNAEVLTCLLQPRNRTYELAARNGKRLSEDELLDSLASRHIRILIDAGAYILEMTNERLVKAWLERDTLAKAAVYFSKGQAWVMYRALSGGREKRLPLVATPWAGGINDEILVFFDEAHCRGVDLKLPPRARAVITLALSQTKDHTVQAAMRLRQLATTQSVTFMGPPEVDASVRDICNLSPNPNSAVRIHSGHIVRWLLEMTCRANEQLQNLHIAQGVDFCRRVNAQWQNNQFLTDDEQRMKLLGAIQGQERQTLEQQYGPITDKAIKGSASDVSFPCLKAFMNDLVQQRKSIGEKMNGHGIRSSALEEVEQEREVEFQVEEVRQVTKPVLFKALKFPGLHKAIENFVRTGELDGTEGYMHVFDSLKNTAIGREFEVRGTDSRFYCSNEFARTVVLGKNGQTADNFLRPVQWILWCPKMSTALVIIPEEAEILIPIIRRAVPWSPVHLITYAAPVIKNMMHFNDLNYYTMPSLPQEHKFPAWFLIELGLFAGRLYMSYDQCAIISDYLQIGKQDDDEEEGESQTMRCNFAQQPVAFLLEWLALRRQVQDIMQTPMGYILQGRTMDEDHPFFSTRAFDAAQIAEMQRLTSSSNDASNDNVEDDNDEDDEYSEAESSCEFVGGEQDGNLDNEDVSGHDNDQDDGTDENLGDEDMNGDQDQNDDGTDENLG